MDQIKIVNAIEVKWYFFVSALAQHFQVGLIAGGISKCGDKSIPSYFTRLDHPEIANFINSPTTLDHPQIPNPNKINDENRFTPALLEI